MAVTIAAEAACGRGRDGFRGRQRRAIRSRFTGNDRVRKICILGAAAAVAGCSSSNDPFDTQRAATASEKHIVVQTAKNELYDPFSIRGAELSTVITVGEEGQRRRVLCARYDSKTRRGEWTGSETHLVAIASSNAVMSSIVVPAAEMPCDRLAYSPFPEAENLRRR